MRVEAAHLPKSVPLAAFAIDLHNVDPAMGVVQCVPQVGQRVQLSRKQTVFRGASLAIAARSER